MKSRANIKGHPIHPILVSFPIAFFTGTLIFDILALVYDPVFQQTALHLEIAGLIGALAAAIPGLIDFTSTVPPRSTGKKRAAKHGITNLLVMLSFGAALFYRVKVDTPVHNIILALEIIGTILLVFAGWMGGTLVYRNQIGIDPRYANAGKWKEEYLPVKNGVIEIDGIADLKLNQMRLIHAEGKRIVIAKTESGYAAFNDHCSHRGGSLASGAMICGTVQCPWHGSQFNVTTGEVKAGPALEKINVYSSKEENGKLYVTITA
jgi:uncharacterized membrane protein/nitrite reductase/ring-hydroxylating ferredoxin subunit